MYVMRLKKREIFLLIEMETSHGFGNGGNREEQYLENLLLSILH